MESPNFSTRTCAEARAWLDLWGVSISEWAELKGFPKEIVYAVLSGRSRGSRGQAYEVAVELGIKPRPPRDGTSPREETGCVDNGKTDSPKPTVTTERKENPMSP
jgi:gp16 family phage-associated protein